MEPHNTSLIAHLSEIEDPRIERTKRHKLVDIVTIAICSTLSLGESWEAVEEFGQTHEASAIPAPIYSNQ